MLASDIFLSPKLMAKTKARIAAGDPAARTDLYKAIVTAAWPAAFIALALLLFAGFSLGDIGFNAGSNLEEIIPYAIAVPLGLVVSTIAIRRRGVEPRVAEEFAVLIPRTKHEQRWFAAVAVTAGITEEISYRALPLLMLIDVLPDDTKALAAVLSAIAFGIAHVYQGAGGVLSTAFMGLVFAALYLYSGSLWPSIATHVLIDIRILVLYPLKKTDEAPAT